MRVERLFAIQTAIKQLAPYYADIDLKYYRKRFRKVMRRLALSRDIDIFSYKLELYIEDGSFAGTLSEEDLRDLMELHQYWQEKGMAASQKVRNYLATKKYSELLVAFGEILEPVEQDWLTQDRRIAPYKIGHLSPTNRPSMASPLLAFSFLMACFTKF